MLAKNGDNTLENMRHLFDFNETIIPQIGICHRKWQEVYHAVICTTQSDTGMNAREVIQTTVCSHKIAVVYSYMYHAKCYV